VPSSPQYKFNDTGLKTLYDNQAKALYQNFSNSLAQIACDTASTAQYSLARTCDDCRRDYKTWLCSVLIPRCEDFTATDPWLMTRNVNTPFADGSLPSSNNLTQTYNATYRERFAYNQSRNPMIDQDIQPGPYKELLPCTDLCYDLVRSCPAALKFGCPKSPALELSYGRREEHNLTCNFPGAVVDLSPLRGGVGIVMANIVFAVVSAVFVGGILEWV
jgi:calcium channel MID1